MIYVPGSSSVAYVSYLLTVIHSLYNCAALTTVLFCLVIMYGTNNSSMWLSFSELVMKALEKKKIRTSTKTNNDLLCLGIVPDISQAPAQGAKIHRQGLYQDKKNKAVVMAVYQVSCTVYAPYIADHPNVAFVDEEYGEDKVDGKFVSNGCKDGSRQIEFKLNLKDQYEPLNDYHHVGTLDVFPYRDTPDTTNRNDCLISSDTMDVEFDQYLINPLASKPEKSSRNIYSHKKQRL